MKRNVLISFRGCEEMRFVSDNMKLLDVIASEVFGVQGVRDFVIFRRVMDGFVETC